MKKVLKKMQNYCIERRTELKRLKADNTISADERQMVEEALATIDGILADIDAAEDDKTAVDALNAVIEGLKEQISIIEQKMTSTQEPATENFLRSRNAVSEWLNVIRSINSSNPQQAKEAYTKMWGDVLKANGITIASGSEDAYLPEAVKGKIEDLWNSDTNWLNKLNNVGAQRFYARYNDADQDNANNRAKGHTPGNTKSEQSLTLKAKEIKADFIYKLLSLSNKTIWNDDNSLVDYVVNELFKQWLYEAGRAVLIGDGRSSVSADKVISVESVLRSTTDAFVTVIEHDDTKELIDEIVDAVATINTADGGDIVLFMSKTDLNALRRVMITNDSTPQYVSRQAVAEQIGVSEIIEMNYLGSTKDARFIAMRPDKYVTVGGLNPSFVQWEDYKANDQYFRVENPFGGAVAGLKSAVVITNPED